MDTVTLSSKYQVVIPRSIRTRARLAPGMRLQVILRDGRIEFVPVRPMRAMRGFLKGYDLSFTRDGADRT